MSQETAEKSSEIDAIVPPTHAPFDEDQSFTTQSTTTTPAPTSLPEDPCEKPITPGPITERDLEMLKNHIRMSKGMQVISPPIKKRTPCKVPLQPPRPTETSRVRTEMRKYRLIQRLDDFVKYHTGEYSEFFSGDKPLTAEQQQALFNKAKHLTAEEIKDENRRAEISYLKYLAEKVQTSKDFRQNRASQFRFKHTRGEPILSSYYEDAYDYHEKPPFSVARRYRPLPCWKLPPIDKNKEMWFVPQDDGDVPSYSIVKEEPKKKKRSHKRVERHKKKGSSPRSKTKTKVQVSSPKPKTRLKRSTPKPRAKIQRSSPKPKEKIQGSSLKPEARIHNTVTDYTSKPIIKE